VGEKIASQIPKGSKVLDIGAGSCRYEELFQHCKYFTQDFAKPKEVLMENLSMER
jgi:hypothetical protein